MDSPVTVPEVDLEALRCEIRKEYAEVAANPGKGFHFHTGWPHASQLAYRDEWLAGVPRPVVESFAGTGNPFAIRAIAPGEKVVDVGSGAGIDSFVAAGMTGPHGRVIGIDMTPEMLLKARQAAQEAGLSNIEFREGHAEALPVEDHWADVVISNGVLNLCPDKLQVLREIARVLRPGGRIQLADISVQKPVADSAKRSIDLWKGWIAGALLEAELQGVVEAAGFQHFEITWRGDVFSGAPQASSAAAFGTLGINFHAWKPA